jgi:hypothetical protein
MSPVVKIVVAIIGILVVLVGIGWLGFQIKPRTSPPPSAQTRDLGTVELPEDLPAPVYRHYEKTMGTQIPKIETAVVWAAPRFRLGSLWVRLRHTTYYAPGQHHRDMEVTWFGIPVVKGFEYHKDGKGIMNVGGQVTEGPQIDQGACLGSWGEALMAMPSIYVTDPSVQWEAVDDVTARLIVPCGDEEVTFTVEFDPETGLMKHLVAMRYRGLEEDKTPWHLEILEWETVDSTLTPALAIATWEDEGKPYLYWEVDSVAHNVDVSHKIPTAPVPSQ